jgi:hypothetical protein
VFVVVPVAAISAVYHALLAFHDGIRGRYDRQVLIEERNDAKWIEYGITSAAISWMVMQLCGVTNVLTLVIAGAALSIAIQYAGHMMELLNTPRQRQLRSHHSDWTAVWQYGTLFTMQWTLTWTYFFALVTSTHTALLPRIPWYIYVVAGGYFAMSVIMGIILILHYAFGSARNLGYQTEFAFMIASFLLKLIVIVPLLVAVITTPTP